MTNPIAIRAADGDRNKGAVEDDTLHPDKDRSLVSFAGQLGHRDQDEMLKDHDTDFPEPDAEAEHSGR